MNLTKIAVHRPVTTFMGILVVLVIGCLSLININLDMMPNMDIPIIAVRTTYDGAGAYEIESLITEPLEGALGTVPGVETITSQSSNGSSTITLEFVDGTDVDMASLDVRDRLALVEDFLPENASAPMVIKFDIASLSSSIVMDITNESKDLVSLQTLTEDVIIPRIKTVSGVADVTSTGGLEKEILITLQPDKLRGFGINESTVQQLLMIENLTLPAGTIKQGDRNMSIRVDGEFKTIEEIQNLPLTTSKGQIIYLRDIATVEEQFKEATSLSFTNGIPSITLSINKQSTANSVDVSKSLISELDNISIDYPNIEMNMLFDPADYIKQSISNVTNSAVVGIILATIILFIFLKDVKVTLVVAIAMPLSIISTFILMYYTGITINMLSLGGLMLGVGMLVDNSIVVIESIFRKIEEGETSVEASLNGSREVSISIIASTLTTIVVFFPITFAGGMASDLFSELTYTITFSLLSSLIVALTFVPMMSALLFKNGLNKSTNRLSEGFDNIYNKLAYNYSKILKASLRKRHITYSVTILFTVFTLISLNFIGTTFIPEMDEGMVMVNISMPVGSLFEDTVLTTSDVVEKIQPIEEIELINASVDDNNGILYIILPVKSDRERSAQDISIDIENRLKDVAGADISVSTSSASTGGMSEASVTVYIYGSEMDTLEQISNDFIDMGSTINGTGTPTSSLSTRTEQANIKIDRDKASAYGLNSNSITSVISTAIDGTKATTFKIDGTEYDVTLQQDANSIEFINDLQNILIPSPYGISIPLYEIADIELTTNAATVNRENQQRYVSVSIPITDSSMGEVQKAFTALIDEYDMPEGYVSTFGGTSEEMIETFKSLTLALLAAILLVYMVMAANFESLVYPFIVMFSIPIAITGAFFGLFIMGEMISMTSFIGFIMLSGIVINNAIVLIDYTNILINEQGLEVFDALVLAGKTRLRPILMSTLTTVLGLIPMALSDGSGSEMLRGLSMAVISGLLFSTVVTLVLIPTVYLSVSLKREKRKKEKLLKKSKKILKEQL